MNIQIEFATDDDMQRAGVRAYWLLRDGGYDFKFNAKSIARSVDVPCNILPLALSKWGTATATCEGCQSAIRLTKRTEFHQHVRQLQGSDPPIKRWFCSDCLHGQKKQRAREKPKTPPREPGRVSLPPLESHYTIGQLRGAYVAGAKALGRPDLDSAKRVLAPEFIQSHLDRLVMCFGDSIDHEEALEFCVAFHGASEFAFIVAVNLSIRTRQRRPCVSELAADYRAVHAVWSIVSDLRALGYQK